VNHTIYRGDTANFRLEVKDYLGASVNIIGWTFILSTAKKRGGTIIFSENGTIQDATNGIVSFQLTPDDTVAVGRYFYDVQATNGSNVYTIDSGEILIISDVTDYHPENIGATCFRISAQGSQA
jgi:hypothetical protein